MTAESKRPLTLVGLCRGRGGRLPTPVLRRPAPAHRHRRALALRPECWSPTSRCPRSTSVFRRRSSTCSRACARELVSPLLCSPTTCPWSGTCATGRGHVPGPHRRGGADRGNYSATHGHPYTRGLLAAIPRLAAERARTPGRPRLSDDPPSPLAIPTGVPVPHPVPDRAAAVREGGSGPGRAPPLLASPALLAPRPSSAMLSTSRPATSPSALRPTRPAPRERRASEQNA